MRLLTAKFSDQIEGGASLYFNVENLNGNLGSPVCGAANIISPTASANRIVTGNRSLCKQELKLIFVRPITSRRIISKEHARPAGAAHAPPWTVEEPDPRLARPWCFVRDANGQALAYVYFEDEPGRRAAARLIPATRRGGSQLTSQSYRSCCERSEDRFIVTAYAKNYRMRPTGTEKPLGGIRVPRYFFTMRRRDRVKDDPHGTNLTDVAAALSYAECKIVELRKEYDDPALMMIVKDEARKTVLSLPFFPGC